MVASVQEIGESATAETAAAFEASVVNLFPVESYPQPLSDQEVFDLLVIEARNDADRYGVSAEVSEKVLNVALPALFKAAPRFAIGVLLSAPIAQEAASAREEVYQVPADRAKTWVAHHVHDVGKKDTNPVVLGISEAGLPFFPGWCMELMKSHTENGAKFLEAIGLAEYAPYALRHHEHQEVPYGSTEEDDVDIYTREPLDNVRDADRADAMINRTNSVNWNYDAWQRLEWVYKEFYRIFEDYTDGSGPALAEATYRRVVPKAIEIGRLALRLGVGAKRVPNYSNVLPHVLAA